VNLWVQKESEEEDHMLHYPRFLADYMRSAHRGISSLRVVMMIVGWSALLACPELHAQTTSTLEGRITDQRGAAIPAADVRVRSEGLAIDRTVKCDNDGAYRFLGLPAGDYTVAVSKEGFATHTANSVEVTLNRTITLPISLRLATVTTEVAVNEAVPLLETTASSSGSTITPRQIEEMPLNGRNYLDLMQLVPGVAIFRAENPSSDNAAPILGDRGGNVRFLIDGLPNSNELNGGAASEFNQDSILEFQVITAGYKAEFGHGSGGIVNVVSKSGTNRWRGGASFFHRNYVLDSSDIGATRYHPGQPNPPFLLRWDPSLQIGGPLLKDKIFFFASAERIRESRSLNFHYPTGTPLILQQLEAPFLKNSQTYDTRLRGKLNEQVGHHRFTEQVNYNNTHITDYLPLTQAINLPDTRNNYDDRRLMLGFSDTATLGDQSNPFLLNTYYQYRGEPSRVSPSHPQNGVANILDNLFSSLTTGSLFGDVGEVLYGPGHTNSVILQKYNSAGVSLAKEWRRNEIKIGWDFQRTVVDGTESFNLFNQLFGLQADLETFGPTNSGVYFLSAQGGATPTATAIRLRNNYDGLFLQDDIRLFKNLAINVGLRWDYDSRFPSTTNISPRVGFAWSVTPKTVVRANYGLFYDHFRLGLARDIPGFGGASILKSTYLSFPRLFYGNPSILTQFFSSTGLNIPCVSSYQTDAQIASSGTTCQNNTAPLYGIDHLNSVSAPGHSPAPAGAAVNVNNVQQLTGLTAQQFADAASLAVGQAAGYFTYDPFGNLAVGPSEFPGFNVPITVDPGFNTPDTMGYQVGVQREIAANLAASVDYYHKDINNILGVRDTNLAFIARIPGHSGELVPGTGKHLIFGYGPWYAGTYDAVILGVRKRMSHRFTMEANYTWTQENDNALHSNLLTDVQTASLGAAFSDTLGPSDNFKGIVPVVTDSTTGKTNANGSFIASNGNRVPQAGAYYNGANLDYGPSDLALKHTFLLHGVLDLPWKLQFSGIFRAQSGYKYTAFSGTAPDNDGSGNFNSVDHRFRRNGFVAPTYTNVDFRIAKRFDIGEHVRFHTYFEMYNLFNAANSAAVQQFDDPGLPIPFGTNLQVLPGREGQIGIRIDF
jgi:hypothetical protein